jgi:hypothetical protein
VHFPNIQLPDSASDPAASMGWFMYRVKPKPNLPFGTVIHNEAAIYFDFNAPIVTNDATTSYNLTVGVKDAVLANEGIVVYPNPSAAVFNVEYPANRKRVEWSVCNLMGQELLHHAATGGAFSVDLGGEPAGFYMLKLNDGNRGYLRRVVKQ